MSALSRLITCLFLIAFIPGCGTFYRTIITMEPVNTGDYTITSNEGICSFLKEGIKVSLVFETRKKLEEVSEYINWNPYVSEQKYFFSVFKLTVENTRQDKIFIDTGKTVLLDSLGGLSNSLSLDYFKSLYPVATMVQVKQEAGNIIVNLPGITLNSNGSAEGLKLEEIKFKFLHKVEIKTITNN